MTLIRNT